MNNPQRTDDDLKPARAHPGQGVLLLQTFGDELEPSETEGGIQFVSRPRALLDAFTGPVRDLDKAEDLLRAVWEQVFG